jgi:uncharacterized protein (TIGR01244 family)
MHMIVTLIAVTLAGLADPTAETLPGAVNYTRVDATVACGGATSAEAFPELRARGFAAVVNHREAGEAGADIEGAARAARASGLRYLHIPLSGRSPSAEPFDRFLAAMKDPANSPVYIHCASANRVGAVWLAKRVLVDGWDEQRALAEAQTIGLSSPALRDFALDYVRRHGASRP